MNKPKVVSIQISRSKGEPMEELESVLGIQGVGLEGDRYATGKGAYSKDKRPSRGIKSGDKPVDRHITLIESEVINDVRERLGLNVDFSVTRRNVLTSGVRLNDLVGKTVKLGELEVLGVEPCDPCKRIGTLSGDPSLKEHLEGALQNKGGLRARILNTGVLRKNDEIRVLEINGQATS